MRSIGVKLERSQAFWEGAPQTRPLLSFHLGDHFFSRQFAANARLLPKGTVVTPDRIQVDDYLRDYLRMAREAGQVEQDAVYVAEPCTGFPWMEAIFGAKVLGGEVSFVAEPVLEDLADLEGLTFSADNPWYQKYLEFTRRLVEASDGRFAVGQPILRGVTDVVGSLVGQEEFACGVLTDPDVLKAAFRQVVKAHRSLIEDQFRLIPSFHGGCGIGFYNLWCPGTAIWYQEDLAALLAPSHHREFLKVCAEDIIGGYDYSLVHMHPAAFAHLDSTLRIAGLKAVQINKDVGGPSVREMMPQLAKVVESGKRLVVGMAFIDEDDVDAIYECLPNRGVSIVALASGVSEANALIEYIDSKSYKFWK